MAAPMWKLRLLAHAVSDGKMVTAVSAWVRHPVRALELVAGRLAPCMVAAL